MVRAMLLLLVGAGVLVGLGVGHGLSDVGVANPKPIMNTIPITTASAPAVSQRSRLESQVFFNRVFSKVSP